MQNLTGYGLSTAVATLSLFALNLQSVSGQDSSSQSRLVTVTGEGKVSESPDVATVHFNIVTRDSNPEDARSANAEASEQAIGAIRDLGVTEEMIRLDQLSLNPVREWDPDERRHIEAGFEINRGVTVKLDDLDLVPTVVAQIVQSGANRIRSIAYGLSNDSEARASALSSAVENARFKATTMLDALGESIGRVMEVREQSVHSPGPVMRAYSDAAVEKASGPSPEAYAPGMIEIVANVTATFEIK